MDAGEDVFSGIRQLTKIEGNTDLIVPLHMREELLGGLTLRTWGEGRYSQEHVELVSCLAKPFAIALANTLAHEEVLRYSGTRISCWMTSVFSTAS